MNRWLIITASCIVISIDLVSAFTSSLLKNSRLTNNYDVSKTLVVLDASPGKGRRRRKRKSQPTSSTDQTPPPVNTAIPPVPADQKVDKPKGQQALVKSYIPISDEATLNFLDEEVSGNGIQLPDEFQDPNQTGVRDTPNADMFELPDIKQALRKKKEREEQEKIEEQDERDRVKIKRSDKEAFRRLLESEPFADANDDFFEKEEYNTVSALLGEESEPFLGIPTGPLQVGHTTLALGIVLMAFVEYPGFPLTNLPTPLRDCLQGGLLSVYLINAVLAVLSIFKAQSRGQPIGLWVAKCLTVGGLAFDQLTQLPTLEEIEAAKEEKNDRFGSRGRKVA